LYSAEGGGFGPLASGDLNGDGLDDVAVIEQFPTSPSPIRLLRSTGSALTGFGSGGAVTKLQAGGQVGDPELRDIDLDGRVDLIVADPTNGRVSWWNGRGDGTFLTISGESRFDRAAGSGAGRLAFGTVGGGPLADLLVTNNTEPFAQVSYLVNTSRNPS
jgi:FG-GAP-like repeat